MSVGEIVINPAVKFLFFSLLKSKKQYKDLKKELNSKIQFLTIVVTDKKMFLRMKAENGIEMDKPFTKEEFAGVAKAIPGVNADNIKDVKHIFILMDFQNKEIKYKQENKDGTKKEFIL